jgi:hypothetical protein
MPVKSKSDLVLGWVVNKGLDPEYWLEADAAPGRHSLRHVVTIPRKAIARHMVVAAQSGSGKSYFLGRIIEEILIKTSCRVVIFDPNSDFRKVAIPVGKKNWEKAEYDVTKRFGFLPDEATLEEFERKWNGISKVVLSGRLGPAALRKELKVERLEIDWTGISTEVLSGELNPVLENEVRRCHDFVRTISRLISFTKPIGWMGAHDLDLIDFSRRLCQETRGKNNRLLERAAILKIFEEQLPFDLKQAQRRMPGAIKGELEIRVNLLHRQAAIHREFIGRDMENFYFSNALSIRNSGLLRPSNKRLAGEAAPRLQVIDLPSVDDPRFRPWVVSTLLDTEWTRAREHWEVALEGDPDQDKRVPTFIVVDEAHNLIPLQPRTHAEKGLLEQFRRIAAEGRKFGLFLVLVSQRPDKLDPLVVSECENRAVMRIGSETVLNKTKELLGLDDVPERMIERCLEFDVGRALLAGPWVNHEPTLLYGAARRTREGGGNLQEDHWTKSSRARTKAKH